MDTHTVSSRRRSDPPSPPTSEPGSGTDPGRQAGNVAATALVVLAALAAVAALVEAIRRPDGVRTAGAIVTAGWAVAAAGVLRIGHPPLAVMAAALGIANAATAVWPAWGPAALAGWLLVGLGLPDGRLGSPRRHVALVAGLGGIAWSVWASVAGVRPSGPALVISALAVAVTALAATGIRYRHASSGRRHALQWVASSGVLVASLGATVVALHLLIGVPTDQPPWLLSTLVLIPFGVLLGLAPVTSRHGEQALVEAIVVAGLTFLVVAVYLVVVIGLGRPPTEDERDVLVASIVAAVIAAVLALPVRARLLAAGRALVGMAEAGPDVAVASFGARMSRAVPLDELMLQLAESLRATLGPAGAEVWVGSDGVLTRAASVPHRPAGRLELTEQERVVVGRSRAVGASWLAVWLPGLLPEPPATGLIRVAPIAHLGELLGLLVVRRPADAAAYSEEDDRVLVELARQVGLALHNVRLDSALQASLTELRHRNEELQASRLRIVTSADESRRAIERNLHDGAQQHLVALAVKLGLTRQILADDPVTAGTLMDELRTDVQLTIAALRELAHGIYPPLLRDRGIDEALRAAANRSPLACRITVDLPGRYPAEAETAVYFCCLEAIQNAGKHAGEGSTITVKVDSDEQRLRFSVSDDGAGFELAGSTDGQGFVNMRDRLGAIGGRLGVRSAPGEGSTVAGTIPVSPLRSVE